MPDQDLKNDLRLYLQRGRDAVVWKLDQLSEYDARRPVVPTGTNLLGIVKHLALVEGGYLGSVFGRPLPDEPAWMALEEPNADLFATAAESRAEIVALYRRVNAHADETLERLPLDAVGEVPWWPEERRHPTLHRVVLDGSAGVSAEFSNLPDGHPAWWQGHRDRVEEAARQAGLRTGTG